MYGEEKRKGGQTLRVIIDNYDWVIRRLKTLTKVAFSGSYNDLTDKPSIKSVEHEYPTIDGVLGMVAKQSEQATNAFQSVVDASADPTVTSGYAYYEYLGTTLGTLADYRKLSEEESMDLITLQLGETADTAYRGDRGKTAYDHSQTAHAPSNAQKNSDISKAEIEAKLTGEITTHTHKSLSINTVATTTYTFLLTDIEKQVVFTSATAVTATIPTNATTAIPIASRIKVTQSGNGVVTLVTTGLTVISSSPLYLIKGQTITLIKTATDTWAIEGNNLNGEIRLPAYPNTRNDGVIPTNKILGTDANGNLKSYSIATAPAPFIDELIPDSYLPSNTGNIELLGEFFIPAMCLTANLNNTNGILLAGQTINYATFVNSQKIIMNVTTSAAEGSFAITCNNGISTTKSDALLIVLGTVFKPIISEWVNTSNVIIKDDIVEPYTFNIMGTTEWNVPLDYLKSWRLIFKFSETPLGIFPLNNFEYGLFLKDSMNVQKAKIGLLRNISTQIFNYSSYLVNDARVTIEVGTTNFNLPNFEIRYDKNTNKLSTYIFGATRSVSSTIITEDLRLIIELYRYSISDIKYIELV